ncbi:bifunctional UDP-N-acetylmuramoyl-tripeptide:D-alanyl-D-alanine ligase/alanine racemase [Roseivirga sp.]|uniref:bifunctional UDP-N-acetylmuramoyl-tripeptide:D-alanyl-D-alanine ligase/alanine racemase n=1 Tax=Roseivirga sp. TaxID=1964215 RepID=UPI003B8D4211
MAKLYFALQTWAYLMGPNSINNFQLGIQEIAKTVGGRFLSRAEDTDIEEISIDSRHIRLNSKELFIALKGRNHNAHEFIPHLIKRGVKNFLVEEFFPEQKGVNILQVDSCLKALQQLSTKKRHSFSGRVIGITGSNGKTIVKEWLSDILSNQFTILKSPKSYNSQIGVPLSVWPISDQHEIGIFEAGISQPNEMQYLADILAPNVGVFTNIGTAHEEFFETEQQKIREKLKLFAQSESLIYCADYIQLSKEIDSGYAGKKISWAFHENARYKVAFIGSSELTIDDGNTQTTFNLNFKDQASLENIVHCIITCLHLGLEAYQIQQGINVIQPIKMRLELKRAINRSYLIDDTYNNDAAGLEKALDFMDQQKHVNNKTVILSDFVQSKITDDFFKSLNGLLKEKNVTKLIAIGPELEKHKEAFQMQTSFFKSTESLLASNTIQEFNKELILIKGARKFELERVSKIIAEKGHKTVLEVNLDAITHNLSFYRSLLKPDTKVMVVVKALAYGSGGAEVSKVLEYHNVDYLAVAYADEGVTLRKNGITLPIMVMNASEDDPFNLMHFNLEPEIFSLEQLKSFSEVYAMAGKKLSAHLILNTGMNRLGFNPDDLEMLMSFLASDDTVTVKSVFTHLAASEDPNEESFTKEQVNLFRKGAERLEAILPYKTIRHILNSGGIVRHNAFQEDMVRLGIGLHGIEVSQLNADRLQNSAVLKTVVSQIRMITPGETIGYGRKGVAEKEMKIATIAIGYADGYLRTFGNGKAYVTINGKMAKTVGNICMDMSMIDITGIEAKVGDEVIVFGDNPTVSQLAEWANTIPYEILTNVNSRVKRVFYTE